jgi:hypothetical protein
MDVEEEAPRDMAVAIASIALTKQRRFLRSCWLDSDGGLYGEQLDEQTLGAMQ